MASMASVSADWRFGPNSQGSSRVKKVLCEDAKTPKGAEKVDRGFASWRLCVPNQSSRQQ